MPIVNGVLPSPIETLPSVTAASVAESYFRKEMNIHESGELDPETVVLVHDSCYGHRYSRPRTSKALLGTIVERPERMRACVLGLSTAYIRLGGRYAEGQFPPHPDRAPNSASAPFRICRTSRSVTLDSPAVTHVHGQRWMQELQIMCDSAEGKLALNGKELVRPIGYGKDEDGNALPRLHEGDLYLCSESLSALEGCLGGVCDAVDTIFGPGNARRAFVCIRPPGHHCSSNYPSGFCWLNNVHVGITYAAMNHGLTHAAIIDFDLHHGDGSQAIAWDQNRKALNLPKNAAPHKKTPVGYYSLHDIKSYPCEMGDEEKVRSASLCIENAHGQSIWNVHLEPWKNHAEFWRLYESKYRVLLDKTRNFLRYHTTKLSNSTSGPKPKAAIFLSAGFDASEWEGEGMQRHKVNVPTDFYARFTADVVKLAEEDGLGADGRVISVLEGGYSDRALTSGVLSHVCGLANNIGACNIKTVDFDGGLAMEMGTRMGILNVNGDKTPINNHYRGDNLPFDPEWWASQQLETLEAIVNPPAAIPSSKKLKEKGSGNYTSPTQASTAKMTDHARERRSISGQLESRMSIEPEPAPPPPEVEWVTAAYELSRILIPANRQTLSCNYDELNAEATRVRRERQSVIGPLANDEPRMQLRDRKAKTPAFEDVPARPASRDNHRRRTIAAVADLPDPSLSQIDGEAEPGVSTSRFSRRRSSGASSIVSGFNTMRLDDVAGNATKALEGDSSQASSAAPERPTKPPVARKPRMVDPQKVQPVKPRTSPKKGAGTAPPVPRVPSAFRPQAVEEESSTAGNGVREKPSSREQAAAAHTAVKSHDLDGLSSGLKKLSIKLKVPPPEENPTKEAAGATATKPRIPKKAPTVVHKGPRSTKSGPSKSASAEVDTRTSMSQSASDAASLPKLIQNSSRQTQNPVHQDTELPQPTQDSESHVVPASDEATATSTKEPLDSTDTPSIIKNVPSFEPTLTQPSLESKTDVVRSETVRPTMGPQAAPHIYQSVQTVPDFEVEHRPMFAPASTKRTRAELPVFTSSSPIPFGRPVFGGVAQNTADDGATSENVDTDLSASAATAFPVATDSTKVAAAEIRGPTVHSSDGDVASGPSRSSEISLWDVPDTPQR